MCGKKCTCLTPCTQCSCQRETDSFIVESHGILDIHHIPGCLCGSSLRYGNALFVSVEKPEIGHRIASMLPSGSAMVECYENNKNVLLIGGCEGQNCIGALRAMHDAICSNGGLINKAIVDDILADWTDEIKVFDFRAREYIEAIDLDKELRFMSFGTKRYDKPISSVFVRI